MLPPGKSEHGYDPTPKEIARLEGAKLGIAVGLDMDTWVENIMKNAGGVPKLLRVGDKVQTMPIDVEPIEPQEGLWRARRERPTRPRITPRRSTRSGSGSARLARSRTHGDDRRCDRQRLAGDRPGRQRHVHEERRRAEGIAQRPRRHDHGPQQGVVEAHDRDVPRLDVVLREALRPRFAAVVEPLAGREPTATYLAEVIEAIKTNHAAALFTEPQLERGPVETIAKEAASRWRLDPIGGVKGRDSYEALLTWNTDQLERVLR